jgi:membrane associated rhomboid family serine protease
MVKWLILIMAAVFAVTNVIGAIPLQATRVYLQGYPVVLFGLVPSLVVHRLFVWQLFTYLFLHGGWLHVIFNLFALWMFGSDLESLWGSRKFLFYFFLTGVGGGLLCVMLQPSSGAPTIGCSGAIFGLLLAYGMTFPERLIYMYMVIPIKAKWFVVIMGVIEFVASYSDAGSGISHFAHLGGMLFGYLYLRGWSLPYHWQLQYHEWRRAQLRKKFEVYMRDQEKKEKHGRWVN